MNNNDIEKDIKQYKELKKHKNIIANIDTDFFFNFVENILADRERAIVEKEIEEENYKNLSADMSGIAKELELEEDAIIDEIYKAIRILKSKRTDMFKYINKANKYDSLVERIKEALDFVKTGKDADSKAKAECLENILKLIKEE